MEEAGYGSYWKQKIEPKLLKSMADYAISPGFLDDIHLEINALSGPEPPDNEYPKTYVLDIGNAFNLLDKTFCTTYLLLDREMAKSFASISSWSTSTKTSIGSGFHPRPCSVWRS